MLASHNRKSRLLSRRDRPHRGRSRFEVRWPDGRSRIPKSLRDRKALAGSPFSTPKPLRFDAEAGRVEFEYVPDTIRLLELMERAYRECDLAHVLELNRSAAEMLALLHRNLKLDSAVRWTPPSALVDIARRRGRDLNTLNEVYMHCDFSPVNIFVKPIRRAGT